jgi:hypothetical protein
MTMLLVYASLLICSGGLLGKLAFLLSRRRLWGYAVALLPAGGLGCFVSAFAIGLARELEVTTGEYIVMASVMSLLALPFSVLGARFAMGGGGVFE